MKFQLHYLSLLLAVLIPSAPAALGAADSAFPAGISRIAFGSCAGQDQPQPIWEAVLAQDPQLWIWAGDNIYGDTEDMELFQAKYEQLLAQPGYRAVLDREIPILGTWDDHDYGRNDAGMEYSMKRESQELFLDFLDVPEDSPRRGREGVYHAETIGPEGKRVQVILLDTRYHRSSIDRYPPDPETGRSAYKPNRDPEATLLGEAQWAWLEEQLREPAELRLIVSSIQFVSGEHIYEKWMNFPNEHRRMLDLLREKRAEGVIFLSGDRHHAELSRLDAADLYPLYDLTSSGLNKSRPRAAGSPPRPPEPNRHRIGQTFRGHHFGTVEIDWDQPDPVVRLSIVQQDGARPVDYSLLLSSLSFDGTVDAVGKDVSGPAGEEIQPDETLWVDGKVTDWDSDDLVAVADPYLYLRFPTPVETSLRRNGAPVHILLDMDGDAALTGKDRFSEAGTDFEIVFSAPREEGDRRWGPRVHAYLPGKVELSPDEIGLAMAPTHASRWFELRLSRDLLRRVNPEYLDAGTFQMTVVQAGDDLALVLAREAVQLPPNSQTSTLPKAAIPDKPSGGIRVLALNTLWGSQLENPEPFGRLLRAINADIYLLQEWSRERISEVEVQAWFRDNVDADADWSAMVAGTAGSWSGTMVVTPHPLNGRVPRATPVDAGGWDFPARFAAGIIETPVGSVLAGSVHLKASGAIRTPEDERRFAEADAVNRILIGMKSAAQPDHVVLGGDFNLNGSTRVMDLSTRMLDTDGSPLTIAQPPVLGDEELFYTFGIRGLRSRLDYITYSDNSLEVVNAFVLDTAILDPEALRVMGLQAEDSAATDHLPVVVDLSPRR
jgi:alkaline phosphatase D